MSVHSLIVLLAAMQPADLDLPLHEKTLKDAGVSTEPAALLKLFRDRTPTEEIKARLAETAPKLGARSYAVRNRAEQDLIRAGRLALPVLRPAVGDADIEVARRAERCIAAIEENNDGPLLTAAAHLLAVRKPAETIGGKLLVSGFWGIGRKLTTPASSWSTSRGPCSPAFSR